MEAILSLVKEGLLRPHVSHSFPLEKVISCWGKTRILPEEFWLFCLFLHFVQNWAFGEKRTLLKLFNRLLMALLPSGIGKWSEAPSLTAPDNWTAEF